jgi:hypothetical protein
MNFSAMPTLGLRAPTPQAPPSSAGAVPGFMFTSPNFNAEAFLSAALKKPGAR